MYRIEKVKWLFYFFVVDYLFIRIVLYIICRPTHAFRDLTKLIILNILYLLVYAKYKTDKLPQFSAVKIF